jgi:hypothetical protein
MSPDLTFFNFECVFPSVKSQGGRMACLRIAIICAVFLLTSPICRAITSENISSMSITKANDSYSQKGRFNLVFPSIVLHGIQPDQPVASEMPRKMDANGNTVFTPGIGLEYKGTSGLTMLTAFVKDCYDDPAGTFQVGEYFKIGKQTDLALTLGVYARQTPYSCDVTRYGKNCYVTDSFNFKFMTTVNGYDVDIIPLPFVHFSTRIYKDSNFELKFKFMGNYLLNEFGLEIPI